MRGTQAKMLRKLAYGGNILPASKRKYAMHKETGSIICTDSSRRNYQGYKRQFTLHRTGL